MRLLAIEAKDAAIIGSMKLPSSFFILFLTMKPYHLHLDSSRVVPTYEEQPWQYGTMAAWTPAWRAHP